MPKQRTMRIEGDVKAYIKELMKEQQALQRKLWWYMPANNGYGKSGVPDFVGLCNGRFFAIETKFGNAQPTPMQIKAMSEISAAGGKVWLVSNITLDGFETEFLAWVELCQ